MNPLPYNEPYNNSGSFLFRKSGVYYFVRRVPTDLATSHHTAHLVLAAHPIGGSRQATSLRNRSKT
ncbi:DUF6538 domain-containing protein [Rhodobacter capsulatus]|uniref:DUF6538 domain-containing protein n=1 Tax=Rhodobacter capsulatus TaxID=1061 RepID=UPI003B8A65CE